MLLTDWKEAAAKNSPEAFRSFLDAQPDSEFEHQANARIWSLAVEETLGRWEPAEGEDPTEIRRTVRTLATNGELDRDVGEEHFASIDRLLIEALRRARGAGRQSIPGLQPVGAGSYRAASGLSVSGEISSEGEVVFELKELYVGTSRMVGDGLLAGIGRVVVTNPIAQSIDAVGSSTVRQSAPGVFELRTVHPHDRVFRRNTMMGRRRQTDPDERVPAADGSLFRFEGRVEGFVDGWTIEAAGDAPLVLVLLEDLGLVHVSGRGTAISAEGHERAFPMFDSGDEMQ